MSETTVNPEQTHAIDPSFFSENVDFPELKTKFDSLEPSDQEIFAKSFIERYCEGPAKCSVVESQPFTDEINWDALGLTPKNKNTARNAVEKIREYISLPVIVDGFADEERDHHEERRDLKRSLRAAFGNRFIIIYEKNKLNWDKLSSVHSLAQVLTDVFSGYPNMARLKELSDELDKAVPSTEKYADTKDLNQRIAFAYTVDHKARRLLRALALRTKNWPIYPLTPG